MSTSNQALAEWRDHWPLPIAAALGYSISMLHVYGIGSFIAPLQQDFGWSRAQISAGLTIAASISGVFCVPVGMLIDRLGPRRIGLVGALLMAAAFALLGTATGGLVNWYTLWCVVAIGTFFVQTTVWTSAIASRFVASRGLALAITLCGASVSATVFPLLATWLIGLYGWRTAAVAMAGIWVALVFPVLLLCFRGAQDQRREPQASGQAAVQAPARELEGISFAEGLRSLALYKLLMAGGLFAFTIVGIVVHFVPILKDSGAQPLAAAGVASLVGIFSIVGRLGTGFLLDRLAGHLVGAAAFVIPIIACALLLLDGTNPAYQVASAVIFGLTLGSEVDVIAYLAAKQFGLRHFGSLYGMMVTALALGTAFGPLAAGAVFDHYGSYAPFLMLTAVLMAASALTLASLGRQAGLPAPALHR
jgi:MFS family permease